MLGGFVKLGTLQGKYQVVKIDQLKELKNDTTGLSHTNRHP